MQIVFWIAILLSNSNTISAQVSSPVNISAEVPAQNNGGGIPFLYNANTC